MDVAKQTPGAPARRALPCLYTHVVMFDSAFDVLRGAPPAAPRPSMLSPHTAGSQTMRAVRMEFRHTANRRRWCRGAAEMCC